MCKFDFVQVCVSVQKNRSSTGKTISYVFEMVIGHSSLNIYWKYIQLYKFVISYSYSYEVSCVQISLCPGVRPCPKKIWPHLPGPGTGKKMRQRYHMYHLYHIFATRWLCWYTDLQQFPQHNNCHWFPSSRIMNSASNQASLVQI